MGIGSGDHGVSSQGRGANLSFAHPQHLLWLWALLLIPLLYLIRRPAKTVALPHLFLWERVIRQRSPQKRRRVREILGMLLQVAIATSLIVAWSGPQVESTENVARPTLIVLDSSLSMVATVPSGESRFDLGKSQIRSILTERISMGPCSLVIANHGLKTILPFGSNAHEFETALAMESKVRGQIDVQHLLAYVHEVKEKYADADVLFFSDGCLPAADFLALKDAGVTWMPVVAEGRNVGFVEGSTQSLSRFGLRISVTLASFGSGSQEGEVRLRSGDELLATRSVSFAQNVEHALEFEVDVPPGTWLTLTWESEKDCFAPDNVFRLFTPEFEPLKVLVVAEKIDRYVKNALAALVDIIDVSQAAQTTPEKWRDAQGYDLTILIGVEEKRPLPQGRYILLNSWAPHLPFRKGALAREVQLVRHNKGGGLLRGIDLRNLTIKTAARYEKVSKIDVILEGTSGPLISRGQEEGVSFVHLGFDLDPKNSSLVLLPAFPLLLKDAIAYLLPPKQGLFAPHYVMASTLISSSSAQDDELLQLEILSESGEVDEEFWVSGTGGRSTFSLPVTWGRARLTLGERRAFSGLNVCQPSFSQVFPPSEKAPQGEERPRIEIRSFLDYAHWFLGLALALLLLEWMLFTRGWTR